MFGGRVDGVGMEGYGAGAGRGDLYRALLVNPSPTPTTC